MKYVIKSELCWKNALNMVAFFEGLRLRVYSDMCGFLTIGYGHKLQSGENYRIIDKSKAMALLVEDFSECVDNIHARFPWLWEAQLFALASLTYNLGYSWCSLDRNLGREVAALSRSQKNGSTYVGYQFNVKWYLKKYVHVKKNGKPIVVDGLIKRRNIECDFFDGKIQDFKQYLIDNKL